MRRVRRKTSSDRSPLAAAARKAASRVSSAEREVGTRERSAERTPAKRKAASSRGAKIKAGARIHHRAGLEMRLRVLLIRRSGRLALVQLDHDVRSEERRVGREWRCR